MEDTDRHTPELAAEGRVRAEIKAFIADPRHLRFNDESEYNYRCLEEWLIEHNFEVTQENLHLAFISLGSTLELLSLAPVVEVDEPEPTEPQTAASPAVVKRDFIVHRNGRPISIEAARVIR